MGTSAPVEPERAPTARHPPRTDPVGNAMAEGATTLQGTSLRSPSSTTVPGSAGRQWGSASTLLGWSLMGTAPVQSQRGSQGSSSPELRAGEGPGATIPLGDSSPGTHPSIVLATDSPVPGTIGTSPFAGGLQRLLTPTGTQRGTRQGMPGPGLVGGWGSGSRPWYGMDVAWQGPHSAPRPSLLSLGARDHGGPVASTAQPAMGMGPTSQPATGKGSDLPIPTTSIPEVTSLSLEGALDLTAGVLGSPDIEGPTEHSSVPLDQTWHPPAVPGQPPTSVAPGSTAAAQSGVPHRIPGSHGVPLSPQPVPTSHTSRTPQPSLGTGQGVRGLGPAAGTPPAGQSPGLQLPHAGSGGDPAETPPVSKGTPVGVGDAGPWAATALPSWQPGSPAPPTATGPPQQLSLSQPASSLGLTTTIGATATAVTTTITAATSSPALLGDVGTVTPDPGATVLQGDASGLTSGPPTRLPTMVSGSPQQLTDPPGTLGHHGGPRSPPAAGDTHLVQPPSSPAGWPDAETPRATPALAAAGRAPRVFIVEDQPPLLRGGSGSLGPSAWARREEESSEEPSA